MGAHTAAHKPIRSPYRYEAVWRIVERIPRGKVSWYGQIARLAGLPRQARFVGYALHHLPPGIPVPWHRVVNARGCVAFRAGSPEARKQQQLLEADGICFRSGRIDLARYAWKPLIRPRRQRSRQGKEPTPPACSDPLRSSRGRAPSGHGA